MEDRELLELAAKSAGLHVDVRSTISGWLWVRESKTHGPYRLWNPLTDDGDALRLAVKLHSHVMEGIAQTPDGNMHVDKDMTDPYAATRRAIVRAAAALATARA